MENMATEEARSIDEMSLTKPHSLRQRDPAGGLLLVIGLAGVCVALLLGIYGSVHTPAASQPITLGFATTITMKVWLSTVVLGFVIVQLLSSLWMYGLLPLRAAPSGLGGVHRISGRLAFIISLPVVYACLYQLGFQHSSFRVLAHSVLGCAFYGAFVSKVMVERSSKLSGRVLPIAGALVFTLFVCLWLTSGLWFITNNGLPGP